MRFRYSILYVNDVPQTLDFYAKAFAMKTRFLHEGKDYGELETGATTLAFASHNLMKQQGKNPAAADSNSPSFEIAFETEDVSAALTKALDAGATLVQELRREPWGQHTAYVTDLNGFLVEICSPIGS